MNRQSAIIIIIFVGILGVLGGYFVSEWREGKKPKRAVVTRFSESAVVVKRVEPTYPPSALKERIEGTVRLMVTVGNDGSASSTVVVKGVRKDIDSAATQAVRLWKFAPSGAMAIVSLDFRIQDMKQADR
jgi:TonB family protein